MEDLKIEYLSVEDIEPYARNTKIHKGEDIAEIQKSIKAFGFNDPIGIWSDHNVIIEGHGRLEAAKGLGIKQVPVIRLDHMTDEQRRAYGILHNKLAELSRWDFEKLNQELELLNIKDFPDFSEDLDVDIEKTKEEKDSNELIFTLSLTEPQYQIIMKVIDYVNKNIPLEHTWGNANKKSNAIFEGAYRWAAENSLI